MNFGHDGLKLGAFADKLMSIKSIVLLLINIPNSEIVIVDKIFVELPN